MGIYEGNGKLEGKVVGRVLRYKWQSDRGTGSGRFVMEEKNFAFSGSYNRGSNPDDVESTWSGKSLANPDGGGPGPCDNKPRRGYERGFAGKFVMLGTGKATYLRFDLHYAQADPN